MIASALSSRFTTFDGATVPEAFIPAIRERSPDIVVFVDAARMGGSPGSVGIFTKDEVGGTLFSTHSMPLSTMARYLECEMGCTVFIVGIEPKSFAFGDPLSTEVKQTADSIIAIFGGTNV
jgi:hydrogenase maturation protease